MSEPRAWDIGGAVPPRSPANEKAYTRTIVVHVVAASAKRAIELVEERYPGIVVHTVQHRGSIEIIEDPTLGNGS